MNFVPKVQLTDWSQLFVAFLCICLGKIPRRIWQV